MMFEKSDLAIHDANIITMNPRQPRAEALVVRDGYIVAIGSWGDVASYAENVQTLDLSGKTVLPGFIDSYVSAVNHSNPAERGEIVYERG